MADVVYCGSVTAWWQWGYQEGSGPVEQTAVWHGQQSTENCRTKHEGSRKV